MKNAGSFDFLIVNSVTHGVVILVRSLCLCFNAVLRMKNNVVYENFHFLGIHIYINTYVYISGVTRAHSSADFSSYGNAQLRYDDGEQ